MSASIFWRPRGSGRHIEVAAPSRFIEVMSRAFGSHPWKLDGEDIGKLEGLTAADGGWGYQSPYEAIVEVILATPNGIEVWPEY